MSPPQVYAVSDARAHLELLLLHDERLALRLHVDVDRGGAQLVLLADARLDVRLEQRLRARVHAVEGRHLHIEDLDAEARELRSATGAKRGA